MKVLGLCWILLLVAAALPDDDGDYYTAGVVEFRPRFEGGSSAELLLENLNAYVELIESAAARDCDIIVFPEGTLNTQLQGTTVPQPLDSVCPCTAQHPLHASFLVRLSCVARDTRKYLVINIKEYERCAEAEPCAPNGWNIFNTNVVFDRRGVVVSRYRKWHVDQAVVNTTQTPELAFFETDFGVRFGHFVCLDMLFYAPAQQLIDEHGVRNIIVTAMHYPELPFLMSTQLYQAWAWANDANLLAAGTSLPASGPTGSGIYAGARGALVQRIAVAGGVRELLVARVPKQPGATLLMPAPAPAPATSSAKLSFLRDPSLDEFTSRLLLNESASSFDMRETLCQSGFCCDFALAGSQLTGGWSRGYSYRIGVFNGWRVFERAAPSRLRICALYACTDGRTTRSCGEIFEDVVAAPSVVFQRIRISGEFPRAERRLLMPNSLDQRFYALEPAALAWRTAASGGSAEMMLRAPRADLLTFGIYANYFDGREPVVTPATLPPLTTTTTATPTAAASSAAIAVALRFFLTVISSTVLGAHHFLLS